MNAQSLGPMEDDHRLVQEAVQRSIDDIPPHQLRLLTSRASGIAAAAPLVASAAGGYAEACEFPGCAQEVYACCPFCVVRLCNMHIDCCPCCVEQSLLLGSGEEAQSEGAEKGATSAMRAARR